MTLEIVRRFHASRGLSVLLLIVAFATPAAAIDKEQRQLMADVRMLQEQNQQLQNILGSIVDAIKAVNERMDDQAKVAGKANADQKLVIDNLSNTVREIREKLDDNNVRLGSLNQEVEALGRVQQLNTRPAPDPAVGARRRAGTVGGDTGTMLPAPGRSRARRRRRNCTTGAGRLRDRPVGSPSREVQP